MRCASLFAALALAMAVGCGPAATPPAKTDTPASGEKKSAGTAPAGVDQLPPAPSNTPVHGPAAEKTDPLKVAGVAPENGKPADVKPADDKHGDAKTADGKPAEGAPDEPKTAEEWRSRAMEQAQSRKLDEAFKSMEKAVALKPDDRDLRFELVMVAESHAMNLSRTDKPKASEWFLKAAKELKTFRTKFEKLTEQEKQFAAQTLYNEACAEALAGNKDRAIAALGEAVDVGWSDLDHMQADEDLVSIQQLPEFKKMLETAAAKAAELAKEHAMEILAANTPFDFDFSLPDPDGKTFTLKQFEGKVVIVDFWGTWCPPCRKEIPHFVELQKELGAQGLEVVGLTYEHGPADKHPELIRNFTTKQMVTYPCLIGDKKTSEMIPDLEGYPTTLFIDRKGKVRAKIVGYHPLPQLKALAVALLEEK